MKNSDHDFYFKGVKTLPVKDMFYKISATIEPNSD